MPTPDPILIAAAQAGARAYAESHPRPAQVTLTQAAEMLGVSRSTVSRMVKRGQIKINNLGMIPIGEVDRVLTETA